MCHIELYQLFLMRNFKNIWLIYKKFQEESYFCYLSLFVLLLSCCTILLSCTHVVSCCLLFCSVVVMSDVTSGCTYVVLCCFMLLSRLDLSFQIKLHCFSELLRWLQKTPLMFFKYYIFWSILNHILAKRQCREENLKAFSVPLKLYIITNGNMFINLFSVW